MGGQIPTKGDVYSYGVLLLEMFTGKCPTDETFRDGMSLHNHVAAESRHGIAKILDPIMLLTWVEDIQTKWYRAVRSQC
jgi:serine/threonine protein kinase